MTALANRLAALKAANDAAWAHLEQLERDGAPKRERDEAHLAAMRASGAYGLVAYRDLGPRPPARRCDGCLQCGEHCYRADQTRPD